MNADTGSFAAAIADWAGNLEMDSRDLETRSGSRSAFLSGRDGIPSGEVVLPESRKAI